MKKIFPALLVVALVIALYQCTDSDSDDAAKNAMSRSVRVLQALVADNSVFPCMDDSGTCSCPGGGELVSIIPESLTIGNCADLSNSSFNGSIAVSGDTEVGTLSVFGECTDVTTWDLTFKPYCAGIITGTCLGETLTCELSDADDGSCECLF